MPSPSEPCTSDIFSSTVSCPSRYRTVGVNGAEAAMGGDADGGCADACVAAETVRASSAAVAPASVAFVVRDRRSAAGRCLSRDGRDVAMTSTSRS